MSEIKYVKGSLFDAPKGTILVHACNAQGVWGSGIAKEFKERFPTSYSLYSKHCKNSFELFGHSTLGFGSVYKDREYYVGCLITSENYGKKVDSKQEILINTTLALSSISGYKSEKFASNKFNSGLFGVPWEETEVILKYFIKRHNLDWTVYET